MNTIQEQWNSFASLVVPKNAPPVQRQEMKRAFYAGAEALARIQFVISGPDMSEDAGVQILEGCHEELRLFAHQVSQGQE